MLQKLLLLQPRVHLIHMLLAVDALLPGIHSLRQRVRLLRAGAIGIRVKRVDRRRGLLNQAIDYVVEPTEIDSILLVQEDRLLQRKVSLRVGQQECLLGAQLDEALGACSLNA